MFTKPSEPAVEKLYGAADIQSITGPTGHTHRCDRVEAPLAELGLLDRSVPVVACIECSAHLRGEGWVTDPTKVKLTYDEQTLKTQRAEDGRSWAAVLMKLMTDAGADDPFRAPKF